MKRKIESSSYSYPTDYWTLEDAWNDIMDYPVARELYYQMINMDPEVIPTWLSGVLAAGRALNCGDFDGLEFIFDRMGDEGVSVILNRLADL